MATIPSLPFTGTQLKAALDAINGEVGTNATDIGLIETDITTIEGILEDYVALIDVADATITLTQAAHNRAVIVLPASTAQTITLWEPAKGDRVLFVVDGSPGTGANAKVILPNATDVMVSLWNVLAAGNGMKNSDFSTRFGCWIEFVATTTDRWKVVNFGREAGGWSEA